MFHQQFLVPWMDAMYHLLLHRNQCVYGIICIYIYITWEQNYRTLTLGQGKCPSGGHALLDGKWLTQSQYDG